MAFLFLVLFLIEPNPTCAADQVPHDTGVGPASFCDNPNKAGIMIDTHHGDYANAANLVGKGGWIVELAFPATGTILQEHLAAYPDRNMVVWGMPGLGTKADADGWCATLGELNTNGKKVFFKPWNTANSTDPKDTYAVKGTPKQVADYQNYLYSCLSESGLLNNKVVLLSPVLITGSVATYPYKDYFNAIKNPDQKKYVGRSLYDVWSAGTACTASGNQDNACKTGDFLEDVGGEYTFAVEGGVANPEINYRDEEMAALVKKMSEPCTKTPGSWVCDDSFIMGAMYANDPDTYGEKWRIWNNGPKTMAAYQILRKNGCVTPVSNLDAAKFAKWFNRIKSTLVKCDGFGYSSKAELCTAPPGLGEANEAEFPPLGSLQSCPQEIPVLSGESGAVCGIEPSEEPAPCKDPSLIGTTREWSKENWCSGGTALIRFCYPSSIEEYKAKGSYDCGGGPEKLHDYGRFVVHACFDGINHKPEENNSYQAWLKFQNSCLGIKTAKPTVKDINMESAKKDLGMCLGMFQQSLKERKDKDGKELEENQLPACIPTTYANRPYPENDTRAQCVSECSPPIDITQDLRLISIEGCYKANGSTCHASIKIQNTVFTLPFAKNLADYYAGTLNGESMWDHEDEFKELLSAMAKGPKDPKYQEAMNAIGVAGKLIPLEKRDQLKCNFLKEVKDKKAKIEKEMESGGYVDADKQTNTKYVWWGRENPDDKNSPFKIKGFKILGKEIFDIPCAPSIKDQSARNAYNAQWGTVWAAVPLFGNEDAQGEIQFVSPSLFSVDPIKVSVPEVNRLNSVTAFIQKMVVPRKIRDKISEPETYGKTITFKSDEENRACKPTPTWDSYEYSGVTYDRAVLCKINPVPSPGEPDSQVCVLEPNGVINCQRQEKLVNAPNPAHFTVDQKPDTTVQVRTIFPGLYDIAEQTIAPAAGLLRIFKPNFVAQYRDTSAGHQTGEDEFEKAFEPVPAQSDTIKYEVTGSNTLDLVPKEEGWKIFFYKLGGSFIARNLILNLLWPAPLKESASDATKVQTPH